MTLLRLDKNTTINTDLIAKIDWQVDSKTGEKFSIVYISGLQQGCINRLKEEATTTLWNALHSSDLYPDQSKPRKAISFASI